MEGGDSNSLCLSHAFAILTIKPPRIYKPRAATENAASLNAEQVHSEREGYCGDDSADGDSCKHDARIVQTQHHAGKGN
jgi:hypothetical protein